MFLKTEGLTAYKKELENKFVSKVFMAGNRLLKKTSFCINNQFVIVLK